MVSAALTVLATLADRHGWGTYTRTAAEGAEVFLHEVANRCPAELACEYAWGITKEELDEALAEDAELRREIRRYDAAIKKSLVQSGINKALEGDTNASRLHLQALYAEKYQPSQKVKLTVEDVANVLAGASDDEVKRLAGIQDTGTGTSGSGETEAAG